MEPTDIDIYKLISDSSYCATHVVMEQDKEITKELPFSKDEFLLAPSSAALNKRSAWQPLGDRLSSLEKDMTDVAGNYFFTVRLDGKNFNNLQRQLQQMELFSSGYSLEYETIMVKVCEKLINYFVNVSYGYTQSDEITLLFSSTRFDETTQTHEPHLFSGRHDKLISLTASLATQFFCKELIQLYIKKGLHGDEDGDSFEKLPIATFDSRIAKFETLSDAFQMVLWRSYDCSVNSPSTALRLLYSTSTMTKNQINSLGTLDKVLLLHREDLLSQLSEHLKYGTLFFHGRHDLLSRALGTPPTSKKRKICTQTIPGQVISNVKEGRLCFGPTSDSPPHAT